MPKIPSFAQGQEDLIILYLLDYKTDGFYVDVGCFHPIQLSNTWLLYQNNWSGICADPNPNLSELYKQHRPRDHFEAVGVADEETTATFYIGNHGVHSSLKKTENSSDTEVEIQVLRLQTLLEKHNAPKIDLLTVDAEGVEVPILNSFDWERYQPRFVMVEYNSAGEINLELQELLINKGYQLLFINNWNFIFTSDFARDSKKLYDFQEEGAVFPPIEAKINPLLPHEKTREEWSSNGYIKDPVISFIIQTHNKSAETSHLIEELKKVGNSEIIVIDDGSEPHHTKKLLSQLTGGNHFLIRANDLYEVITYDRAIHMARGHLVALLQDDDGFDGFNWISSAITHFQNIPDLAILGGRMSITPLSFETDGNEKIGEYSQKNGIGEVANLMRQKESPDSEFPTDFQFAPVVVRAPMWIRREMFIKHLQHIDQNYAPFLVDDYELCFRAWMKGLKVGYYPARFKIHGLSSGGMKIWNNNLTKEQSIRNFRQFYGKYGNELLAVQSRVKEENKNYYQSK